MIRTIFDKNMVFFQHCELFSHLVDAFAPTECKGIDYLLWLLKYLKGFELEIVLDLKVGVALTLGGHGLVEGVESGAFGLLNYKKITLSKIELLMRSYLVITYCSSFMNSWASFSTIFLILFNQNIFPFSNSSSSTLTVLFFFSA